MQNKQRDLLQEATDNLVSCVSGDEVVEDILTRVVIDCIRRYQEKVGAGVQDSASDLLATFKLKIADEVLNTANSWTLATKREMILFPNGCRFLYTRGRSTFVVIEQPPGPHTLKLDESLLSPTPNTNNTGRYGRHFLAIPYSVFIFQFSNDEKDGTGKESLKSMFHAWRPCPLNSVADHLFHPYLPNIHKGLSVCRGHHPETSFLFTDDGSMIARATNLAIEDFWGSVFNTDLSNVAWWGKAEVPEIATVQSWEHHTRTDPLFILGLKMRDEGPLIRCLNNMVRAADEGDLDSVALRHRLSDLIDKHSTDVFEGILRYLKKTKFEKFHPKDVTNKLVSAMEPIAKQIRVLADGIELELNRIAKESDFEHGKDYGWEKRGSYWTN